MTKVKNNNTKEEPLEKQLFKAADKLRKNIDAAEYKHIALGLIFLRYISDAFEELHRKLLKGEGDYVGADPEDKDEYKEEKQHIADMVVSAMEARLPQIAGNVEVVDVATPITYKRFTNNWQGSFEGWLLTTDNMSSMVGKGMSKTLPGLDNFYMIGQWVMPGGGLPPAAQSGRDIIQIICHRDKKSFTTSEP